MSDQTHIETKAATGKPHDANGGTGPVGIVNGPSWDRALLEASHEKAVAAWRDSLHGYAKRLEPLERVRFFASLARSIDEFEDEAALIVEGGIHPRHRIARFDEFVAARLAHGSKVLDLGCGDGTLTVSLADRVGGLVVGVDQNAASLRRARALAQVRGVQARFIEDDLTTCLVEGAFDAVVLSGVIEQVDDAASMARKIVGWYAPKAIFIRAEAFDSTWKNEFRRGANVESSTGSRAGLTRGEIEHCLGSAGYRPVEVTLRWGDYWVMATPDGIDRDAPIRVPIARIDSPL